MQVNREVTGEAAARAGFDAKVFADMFATLDWSADDEIPVPDGSSQPNCDRTTQPGDQN